MTTWNPTKFGEDVADTELNVLAKFHLHSTHTFQEKWEKWNCIAKNEFNVKRQVKKRYLSRL